MFQSSARRKLTFENNWDTVDRTHTHHASSRESLTEILGRSNPRFGIALSAQRSRCRTLASALLDRSAGLADSRLKKERSPSSRSRQGPYCKGEVPVASGFLPDLSGGGRDIKHAAVALLSAPGASTTPRPSHMCCRGEPALSRACWELPHDPHGLLNPRSLSDSTHSRTE